jgi:hypothetical protein
MENQELITRINEKINEKSAYLEERQILFDVIEKYFKLHPETEFYSGDYIYRLSNKKLRRLDCNSGEETYIYELNVKERIEAIDFLEEKMKELLEVK